MDNKFEIEKKINMEQYFNRLSKANTSEVAEELAELGSSVRQIYGGNVLEIDNIGIICRNKIIELEHEFEKHDLSMFASSYNVEGTEVIGPSIIGSAIELEMLERITKAGTILQNTKSLISEEKNTHEKSLVPQTFLSKFWAKVKGFFFKQSIIDSELSKTENTIETIRESVSEYQNICDEVQKYSLQNNLADTVGNFMNQLTWDEKKKREDIEGNIIPEFTKLELENLVPSLRKKIILRDDNDLGLSIKSRDTNEGKKEYITSKEERKTNAEIKKDDGMER